MHFYWNFLGSCIFQTHDFRCYNVFGHFRVIFIFPSKLLNFYESMIFHQCQEFTFQSDPVPSAFSIEFEFISFRVISIILLIYYFKGIVFKNEKRISRNFLLQFFLNSYRINMKIIIQNSKMKIFHCKKFQIQIFFYVLRNLFVKSNNQI